MTNEHSHNQVCGTLNREAIIIFLALRRNLTGFQPDGLSARSVFRLHSAV
jgi:hypothetical protein